MSVLVVVAVALAALAPSFVGLHERWTDADEATYTHGYLIAALCVFLLWRANAGRPLDEASRQVRPLAVLLLAAAGLVWLVALRAGVGIVEWMMLPLLLWLAVLAAFGPAIARRNLFAVGFLYFAIPLWGSFNAIFQWATVFAVRGLLRVIGIPSHFSGNFVEIPAGTFEIAGGCSGLHYVIVALALAALMGEVRGDDWKGRARLLLLAGALAVVTNWIRVFIIIVAGHHTDMQHYLVAQSHYGFGWVLFAAAMVVFFVLERRMALPRESARHPARNVPSSPLAFRPAGVAVLVLATIAGLQAASARSTISPAAAAALSADAAGDWAPRVEGADAQLLRVDPLAGEALVQVRQYIFHVQRQGKELGGFGNDLTAGHTVLASESTTISDRPAMLHEARDSSGRTWLIAISYQVAGRHFAAPLPAQLHYAFESLSGLRSAPASILLWRTPCDPDCGEASARIAQSVAKEAGGTEP